MVIAAKRVRAASGSGTLLTVPEDNARLYVRNTSNLRMVYLGGSPGECLFGLRPRETFQLNVSAGKSIYVRSGGGGSAYVETLTIV